MGQYRLLLYKEIGYHGSIHAITLYKETGYHGSIQAVTS